MAYLLDADVFIQAKNLHYAFDFCPAFWDWLDAANAKHTAFSVEKVHDELLAGDDQLSVWARDRGTAFFLPPIPPSCRASPRSAAGPAVRATTRPQSTPSYRSPTTTSSPTHTPTGSSSSATRWHLIRGRR